MNSLASKLNRVSNKLMISFLVVAFLPAAIIGVYAERSSVNNLLQEGFRSHAQNIDRLSLQVANYFDNARGDIKFLSRSFPLERYLEAVALKDSVSMTESLRALEQELLEFADSRGPYYAQVRYIDELGKETARVDLQGSSHVVRPRSVLQDKGNSDYFQNTVSLKPGSLFISKINLNRDNGELEAPINPVIRYAMPVQYPNGRPAGIVVVNVRATPILRALGDIMLLSEEGFYLNHKDETKLWGAPQDLNTKISFAQDFASEWQQILPLGQGHLTTADEQFFLTFKKMTIPGGSASFWLVEETSSAMHFSAATQFRSVFYSILVGALIIASMIAVWAGRSITSPLNKLTRTVQMVTSGEQDVRAEIETGDEFQVLGDAFDQMIDERIATMARMEVENEALNNSIIELMEATAKLSEYDLSIKVPVREDITGVVADGLNKMIKGTNKILEEIREVSEQVAHASQVVKDRSDAVTQVAQEERQAVEDTLQSLDKSAKAMQGVAELAKTCTNAAETAIGITEKALQTVTSTVDGMNEIRSTISETEKRIKRLGERSQEINSAVEIINNIAERTHVLALNASMQAAAAGEAGRGFAVVADEVQRLAENSRNSTSQIAALVHNIQAETAETMATMNRAISQVVSGSELAEQAGRQMEQTQVNTRDLVESVLKIAEQAVAQAEATNALRRDAAAIRISTQVTGEQLQEQAIQTDYLVNYAQSLRESVDIFRLSSEAEA